MNNIDRPSNILPPSPPVLPPAAWHVKIAKKMGHFWSYLVSIPFKLFQAIKKISVYALSIFSKEVSTNDESQPTDPKKEIAAFNVDQLLAAALSPKQPLQPPIITLPKSVATHYKITTTPPFSAITQHVNEKTTAASLANSIAAKIPEQKQSSKVGQKPPFPLPPKKKTNAQIAADLENLTKKNSIPVPTTTSTTPSIINSMQPQKVLLSKQAAKMTMEISQSKNIAPNIIDVPDDGNCLFSAFAVGLKKTYPENEKMQELLSWDIDPKALKGGTKINENAIKPTALRLRALVTGYLKEHKDDEFIKLNLLENIETHNRAIERQIDDLSQVIEILRADRDVTLKNIEIKEEELNRLFSRHNPGVDKYINMLAEDRFFGDSACLYVLSLLFEVPIKETYKSHALFNEDVGIKPITIRHVNGNHFQYEIN